MIGPHVFGKLASTNRAVMMDELSKFMCQADNFVDCDIYATASTSNRCAFGTSLTGNGLPPLAKFLLTNGQLLRLFISVSSVQVSR